MDLLIVLIFFIVLIIFIMFFILILYRLDHLNHLEHMYHLDCLDHLDQLLCTRDCDSYIEIILDIITRLFVEQPWLHKVCLSFSMKQYNFIHQNIWIKYRTRDKFRELYKKSQSCFQIIWSMNWLTQHHHQPSINPWQGWLGLKLSYVSMCVSVCF